MNTFGVLFCTDRHEPAHLVGGGAKAAGGPMISEDQPASGE